MMTNLFSMFDPVGTSLYSGVWVIWCFIFMLMFSNLFVSMSGLSSLLLSVWVYLKSEVDSLLSNQFYMSPLILSVFISIITLNSLGLIPYSLTLTSFITLNFSLALSLWLGPVLFSIKNSIHLWLAHLVPLGTPPALMPLMVLIESVSIIIRPLTLSVRLLANMLAGHLLLSLVGSALKMNMISIFVLLAQTSLVILELAVAFLQSIVFMTLITLYSKE